MSEPSGNHGDQCQLEEIQFSVQVPREEQRRYLRGGCFAFAVMLRRYLAQHGIKSRIYGLFDGTDCHHAFIVANGKAYDCRGEMKLDPAVIGAGSAIGTGGKIRPVTVKYLESYFDIDLYNIMREIDGYVTICA